MILNTVENLILYGVKYLDLPKDDIIYVRNELYSLLKVYKNEETSSNLELVSSLNTPDLLIDELVGYALSNKLIDELEIDMFSTKIMGILTPRPSYFNEIFNNSSNKEDVLEYLYNFSIKNNYIKQSAINKNIVWQSKLENNHLILSINLSKPEKSNKEVSLLLTKKNDFEDRPKCMLCKENVGFAGSYNYPARQTLRTLPLKLNEENWFVQFSPYAYFKKHCIIVNETHKNMEITTNTIIKLLDFVDYFPHYFIGSNASLPIVGGSILNHEHFQGGEARLPLMLQKARNEYYCKDFSDIKIEEVDWHVKTLRLVSSNRVNLSKIYEKILLKWINYSNKSINLYNKTTNQHNTLNPIVYMENGEYVLNLVFRNNFTNDEYPNGMFHAHEQYHNIKKEAIGMIEVLGLFVLPPRLKTEVELMSSILESDSDLNEQRDLTKHLAFIKELKTEHKNLTKKEWFDKIYEKIEINCAKILENVSVFKNNELGNKAFNDFLLSLNIRRK